MRTAPTDLHRKGEGSRDPVRMYFREPSPLCCYHHPHSTRSRHRVASAFDTLRHPGESTFLHDQLLKANPSRPMAPASAPRLPNETASRGIKPHIILRPEAQEPTGHCIQLGDSRSQTIFPLFFAVIVIRCLRFHSATARHSNVEDPRVGSSVLCNGSQRR